MVSLLQVISRTYWTPTFRVTFCSILVSPSQWGVTTPSPNPPAGGPLVCCLLIQYIQRYPLYLEAVTWHQTWRDGHAVKSRDPLNIDKDTLSTDKDTCHPTPQWLLSFRNHNIKAAAKQTILTKIQCFRSCPLNGNLFHSIWYYVLLFFSRHSKIWNLHYVFITLKRPVLSHISLQFRP